VGNGAGPGTFRLYPFVFSDGAGDLERLVDFGLPPAGAGAGTILPGSTWNFQWWYRDFVAGAPWFNLSDGLAVTFCP